MAKIKGRNGWSERIWYLVEDSHVGNQAIGEQREKRVNGEEILEFLFFGYIWDWDLGVRSELERKQNFISL